MVVDFLMLCNVFSFPTFSCPTIIHILLQISREITYFFLLVPPFNNNFKDGIQVQQLNMFIYNIWSGYLWRRHSTTLTFQMKEGKQWKIDNFSHEHIDRCDFCHAIVCLRVRL